jgi:hypothetical protein
MSRPLRLLAVLALGVALATATTAVAAAAQPSQPTTEDLDEQRKGLYQSELEHNLQQQRNQAEPTRAVVELFRSMERNSPPVTTTARPATPQPAAPPAPATAVPRPVGMVASLLLGLVGGLVGGCAALAGWTAATRRRPRQPASAT